MTTSSAESAVLLDSSAAVPLTARDHHDYEAVRAAVGRRRLGLAGHAAFETFAVVTRMPAPARRPPAVVGRLLRATFPASVFLSAAGANDLLGRLAEGGITGGAAFDALVGAAAAEHGMTLLTRDRRASGTYVALGVEVEFIGG